MSDEESCCTDLDFSCCEAPEPYDVDLVVAIAVGVGLVAAVLAVICFRCRSKQLGVSPFTERRGPGAMRVPLVPNQEMSRTSCQDEFRDLGEEEINSFLLTIQPGGKTGQEVAYNVRQFNKLGSALGSRLRRLADLTGNDYYLLQARLLQARSLFANSFTPMSEACELRMLSTSVM